MPDPYIAVLIALGFLVLLVAWVPMLLKEMPLSLPIVCVGVGWLGFRLLAPFDEPLPQRFPHAAERLTEFAVIVSLTGCGLKLDRPFGRREWRATWRLLGIAMPLSILALAVLGASVGGLSLAAAALLGAAMAPTDPVLASDVQVGPPGSGEEDEVRFALTSEAGLNDGLAFPFTNFALALGLATGAAERVSGTGDRPEGPGWAWEWLALDVAWKLLAGLIVGLLVGRVLGALTFRLPNRARLSRTGEGFLALGICFLAYGLAEAARGYGFLAVFVAAVAFRAVERHHAYHERLHEFSEQAERLIMMVVLVLFGGALAAGILAPLTWGGALAGLLFLFVVRPLATWVSFAGLRMPAAETAAIGFFGIRGLGSLYYVAYAATHAEWEEMDAVWATVAFIVLVSIVLHGTTVTPALRVLDRRRGGGGTAVPRG
jgi:NhaP-type Na+/H+ or K+/H+ antiporter